MVAYSPDMSTEQRQELLETIDVEQRLKLVSGFLARQIEILELKGKIQSEVKSEMDKTQREYILREQLKAIQRELGEDDPQQAEINELREKVESSGMPEEVRTRAIKEIDRMSRIPSASPEVGVIRTYVDWLVSLPWTTSTDDRLDIKEAAGHPRRGPLRPREGQGAHPRVPRGAQPRGHDPQPHPAVRRPSRRGQDQPRQEHRQGDGPQVHPDEPGRHPRRGGDPRPPAHLHRRAARPDHPEHQDRRHQQPRVHAGRGRQDRHGLPGRPVVRAARGAGPGAELQLPGQLPRGPVRPAQGAVRRDRQPARPHPGRPARPDGGHPAAGLHPAGEGRDRAPVPRPQADGEPRPARPSTWRSPTRCSPSSSRPTRTRPASGTSSASWRTSCARSRAPWPRAASARPSSTSRSSTSTSARRGSSTASWRPRTRRAPRPASS